MFLHYLYRHCYRAKRKPEISISFLLFIQSIHSKEDSYTIFRDAAALNMTESGYVWIVTEQALNANNTPDGVIGLQLVHAKSEKNHIRVSCLTNGNVLLLFPI